MTTEQVGASKRMMADKVELVLSSKEAGSCTTILPKVTGQINAERSIVLGLTMGRTERIANVLDCQLYQLESHYRFFLPFLTDRSYLRHLYVGTDD